MTNSTDNQDMVEAVARALANNADTQQSDILHYPFEGRRDDYLSLARAAIEAQRKSTGAMVEAACLAYWPLHWADHMADADKISIREHMRKAIDAALNTSKQE